MVQLGGAATLWQRAGLLHHLSRLGSRQGPLLRSVVAETLGLRAHGPAAAQQQPSAPAPDVLPARLLAMVALSAGQLQHRPPDALAALHAARGAHWRRMTLAHKAAVTWALLALTGARALEALGADAADRDPVPGDEPAADAGGGVVATAATEPHADAVHTRAAWEGAQLAAALGAYLQAAASTGPGTWPQGPHVGPHEQLLCAAAALAGWWRPTSGAQNTASAGQDGATAPSDWHAQLAPLLRRLRAPALRGALTRSCRVRRARLRGWATEVTAVLGELLATSRDGREVQRWRLPRGVVLAAGQARAFVPACGGALQADIEVTLELERRGARLPLCLALELCPVLPLAAEPGVPSMGLNREATRGAALPAPPPPATCADAAAGTVRNSRWLLSGGTALRVRLLSVAGGAHVVLLRERAWRDARSGEQRSRLLRELLRGAVQRWAQEQTEQ
jgi:hypothetical protein